MFMHDTRQWRVHFHDHSLQKSLFLGFRGGILNKIFIEATIPMVRLRVVYALFYALFVYFIYFIIYSVCCSRHSVYFFFNRFISRIENKFKPPRSDRGFLFERFFQKSSQWLTLSPISVITQRFILLTTDLSILTLVISFITRTFSPSARSFPHPIFSTFHIARGIIKLIARTTSFLEERLGFEISWLIWNANNPTMSPPWAKGINLYLKRLLIL